MNAEDPTSTQANRAGMWRFIALLLMAIIALSLDCWAGITIGIIALFLLAVDR